MNPGYRDVSSADYGSEGVQLMQCSFRKTRSPQKESRLTDTHLLQITFAILVVSVADSTKVSARPALLGASAATKRTIFARKCPLSSTSNKVLLLEEEDGVACLPNFQIVS